MKGKENTEHKAGTAVSDVAEAEEGEKVTLTATAKAGYSLKEYQIENVENVQITRTEPLLCRLATMKH